MFGDHLFIGNKSIFTMSQPQNIIQPQIVDPCQCTALFHYLNIYFHDISHFKVPLAFEVRNQLLQSFGKSLVSVHPSLHVQAICTFTRDIIKSAIVT